MRGLEHLKDDAQRAQQSSFLGCRCSTSVACRVTTTRRTYGEMEQNLLLAFPVLFATVSVTLTRCQTARGRSR